MVVLCPATFGSPSLFFDVDTDSYPPGYLMLYDNMKTEVVLVPLDGQPNVSWIETIYIHNNQDYEDRKTALLSNNHNRQLLREFDTSKYCQ